MAIKVPDSMIFLEPNMAVIGRVDLDDTDNVISSENLIKVAQEAKTFVGDAKENIIDFRAPMPVGRTGWTSAWWTV